MTFATSSSNVNVVDNSCRENMVDYADEMECFYIFRYFD